MSKNSENAWCQIRQHFESAKKLLLELSTELAQKDGDWNRARILFDLARDVDELQIKCGSLSEASTVQERTISPMRNPDAAIVRESTEEYPLNLSEQSAQTRAEPKPRLRRRKRPPVFFVQNNSLVKQGLKRNGKDNYEHKMSKEEFIRFIDLLSELAAKQQTFRPEEVVDSLDMSSYKVYLALGAMNHIHVLEIPQRGTYRFRDTSRFLEQGSDVWNVLDSQSQEATNEL